MEDKTAIGISDLLRQFIEALVEDVVIEGKPFDDQKKKWLQRYSQEECVDYVELEKNLTEFFETIEELKSKESKAIERLTRMIAEDCFISDSVVDKLISAMNEGRIQIIKRPSMNMVNGHRFVDLGLPSGILWATCNVGANKPEDYGDYFSWGETRPKNDYELEKYNYFDKRRYDFTKYTKSDGLKILQSIDDAAMVNWGEGCRIPTREEWKELIKKTSNIWTVRNGINGRLFTSSNGNSLFLPASSSLMGKFNGFLGTSGHYWSSSLSTLKHDYASHLVFKEEYCDLYGDGSRYYGFTVRPVHSAD
jgi:hypothetical protein